MNAQDTLKANHATSTMVLKAYVSDFSDADLMVRPGPGCNHAAWQLGHLIASECDLLEMAAPGAAFKLPEGFADQHAKDKNNIDDASQFKTKSEYLALMDQVQAATVTAIENTNESDLDAPGPEAMREWCPTVGTLYVLITAHAMMHAGQLVPVRRALGKPILM
ncbi:MAG: DinB family protein [Algisphaera sp.]